MGSALHPLLLRIFPGAAASLSRHAHIAPDDDRAARAQARPFAATSATSPQAQHRQGFSALRIRRNESCFRGAACAA